MVGPDLLWEMEENMVKIRNNLKVAQDNKKTAHIKAEPIEILKWLTMCS
jgi:hypothetical protein